MKHFEFVKYPKHIRSLGMYLVRNSRELFFVIDVYKFSFAFGRISK